MIGSATFSDSIQPGYGVFSADSTIAGRTIVSCFGFAPRSVRSPMAFDSAVRVAPAEGAGTFAAALGELFAHPLVAQDLGAGADGRAAGGADRAVASATNRC